MVAGKLSGQTFVVTGTLEGYSRAEAKSAIEALGGKVAGSVSGKTDRVILGTKPGWAGMKAMQLGAKPMFEAAFKRLLGGTAKKAVKKKATKKNASKKQATKKKAAKKKATKKIRIDRGNSTESLEIKTKKMMNLPISFFCCVDEEQSELKEFRVALLSLKVSMVNNDGYIRYVVAWGYSGGGMQADIQSKYIVFTKTDTRYLFIGAGDEWNNVYLKNGINDWEKIYDSWSSDPAPSCTNEDEDRRTFGKLGKGSESYIEWDDDVEFLILTDTFSKGLIKKEYDGQIQYFTKDFDFECLYEISNHWSLLTRWERTKEEEDGAKKVAKKKVGKKKVAKKPKRK